MYSIILKEKEMRDKKVEKYLSDRVIETIREEIEGSNGYEVFFVGWLGKDNKVESVEAIARGDEESVPVILDIATKADVVIHNHPTGILKPSKQDLLVASQLGNSGVGFYIVNNLVDKIYVVVEPVGVYKYEKLELKELLFLLSKESPLAKEIEKFEERLEQKIMLEKVVSAFNENKILLVEAGTGTGKSIAYLLPSMYWARKNKERVIISTKTINLQQQLIDKDIPLLKRALGLDINYCLVKGRSNYVCLQKLENVRMNMDEVLDKNEVNDFQVIYEWSKITRDGSISDLNFLPKDSLWEKVCCEQEACLRTKCKYFNNCFFYKARKKASISDIVVINHHLFFADLALKIRSNNFNSSLILPVYKRVILDEAHSLEDSGSSYFGNKISFYGILRIIHRFYQISKAGIKGLLIQLKKHAYGTNKYREMDTIINSDVSKAVTDLENFINKIKEDISEFVIEHSSSTLENEFKLRITESLYYDENFQNIIIESLDKLITKLSLLLKYLEEFKEILLDLKVKKSEFDLILYESNLEKLFTIVRNLNNFIEQENEQEYVRWIEVRKRRKDKIYVTLVSAPLEIGEILKESLYTYVETIVFTSATLTAGDNFEFFRERLGLDDSLDRELEMIQLPSSFNFKEQVLLAIPMDLPEPNDRTFPEAISNLIREVLKITKGRAFILFTSFSLLRKVYEMLEDDLINNRINPLRQGVEDRHRLLKKFKNNDFSALFATDSFWEGVDVPGKHLQCVILTRLPFRVPTEPIIEARVESIRKKGKDPFLYYTVPQAILKFKQGFGRLIRKKDDKGTVIILDKRIMTRNYGKKFLNALPDCYLIKGPSILIKSELKRFFNNNI